MSEFFSGSVLNRWSFKRSDSEWLLSQHSQSQVLLLNSKTQRHLASSETLSPYWLSTRDLPDFLLNRMNSSSGNWIFLGRNDDTQKMYWVLDVASISETNDAKWVRGASY